VGFLQNTAATVGPYVVAGSRLWTTPEAPAMPGGEMGDEQVDGQLVEREARRLGLSIEDAEKQLRATPGLTRVVAVHFPPLYANRQPTAFSTRIEAFRPAVCVYGHLHGTAGFAAGFQGEHGGVRYVLASADAAGFKPVLLLEGPRSAASVTGVAERGGSPVG
jgi:predicted phosphohydrolase